MAADQTLGPLDARPPAELGAAWLAAWAGREPSAFDGLCAAGATWEGPTVQGLLHGPRAIAAHAGLLWRAFPDLALEAAGPVLAEGKLAAVPWRAAGTQRGELGTLPASGRELELQGVDFLEAQGGRVVRARSFFDLYEAAVRLGVLPQRGTLSERALLVVRGFGVRIRGGA